MENFTEQEIFDLMYNGEKNVMPVVKYLVLYIRIL